MFASSFIALSKYLKIINYPSSLYYSTYRLCRDPLSPSSLTLLPPLIFRFTCSARFSSSSHPGTFMELVKKVCRRGTEAADSIAIRAEHESYSYKQLISSAWEISDLLCNSGLETVDGVRGRRHLGGARIGIVAKPSAEFVAGILATWFSGGVAVPLALSYPETELLHVMNDAEISMVLSTEDHQQLMQSVAAKCAAQFSLIPSVHRISSHESVHDHPQIEEIALDKGDDPALIIYTSGTTGKPKGAVQTLAEAWEYTSTDQFLNCLPLHHIHQIVVI
uniref:AMP-dependent synthetase/ligase domain-containing protein n=1 Tax=Salix viminalis TaxID=40686 RepID=A0A6N2M925_SALVM